jgi:DHA1 family inner membrane transport protein
VRAYWIRDGFFADRFDRKNLLTAIFLGFTMGTPACALSPTYEVLLLSRIITGILGGVLGSIVLAIVSDLVPVSRRGHAMGIINTAFSTASVIGVPLGLFLASLISWHAPFLFIVAIAIPVLVLLQKKIPSVKSHIRTERVKPLDVLRVIWQNQIQRSALYLFVC